MEKATPKSSPITHTKNYNISDQSIDQALASIPASIPHDEWVKTAMALKSAGIPFEVFDVWSSSAPNYSSKDSRDTWRSIEPRGGITIASLFHIAKQYGYHIYQSKADHGLMIERSRLQQQKVDKDRQKKIEKAKWKANQLLDLCNYSNPNHPYFLTKQIVPPVPVWQLEQSIVIPVMDFRGEVHSLQFIQPDGKKTFLKDGVITGHFYQIWSRKKPSNAIVICEGYATAVTLAKQYTPDCTVIVAFNAGNLKPVAKILRKKFVDAPIIIAGDRDASGVGQKKAKEAALAVGGTLSIPPFLSGEKGSDWNDYWTNREREASV